MVAGIFVTKKRAACFATLRVEKKASCRDANLGSRPTERRRRKRFLPPTLNGSKALAPRRSETGRPVRAVALSSCPSKPVTDSREESSRTEKTPPQATPSHRCHRSSSCDDGGDDAWSRPARIPQPALPCSIPLQAPLRSLRLPEQPELPQAARKPASPSRWRRELRTGLKGCASYSLDLLGSGRPLMGRNLTIRGIAIPVPSGSRQDLRGKLAIFW